MIEIIHQLILLAPTVIEIINDRKGDKHTDMRDVYARAFFVVVVTLMSSVIHALYDGSIIQFYRWLLPCMAVSVGYFCAFFNYGVNIVQRKLTERDNWWSHLNNNSWPDNWRLWRVIGWKWRMAVSFGILAVSLLWYFW